MRIGLCPLFSFSLSNVPAVMMWTLTPRLLHPAELPSFLLVGWKYMWLMWISFLLLDPL